METDAFEWDEAKARLNRLNHGVTFEDATFVFDDPIAMDDVEDSLHYGEQRWEILGVSDKRLLTVIYTFRGTRIRIISAREADRHEHQRYNDPRRQT